MTGAQRAREQVERFRKLLLELQDAPLPLALKKDERARAPKSGARISPAMKQRSDQRADEERRQAQDSPTAAASAADGDLDAGLLDENPERLAQAERTMQQAIQRGAAS